MFSILPFAHVFDTAICACFRYCYLLMFKYCYLRNFKYFICSYVAKTTNLVIIMVRFVIPGIIGIAVYLEIKRRQSFLYYRDERLEHAPCACDALMLRSRGTRASRAPFAQVSILPFAHV